MSQDITSVIDYFTPNGELIDEASEFEGIDLSEFVDKRSKITPDYVNGEGNVMQFDLKDGTEVSFYRQPSCVYGEITYPGGIKTILFKCRQVANLKRFIRMVLEIGSWDVSRIHADFRIN